MYYYVTKVSLNSYLNGSTISLIKLNYSTIPMEKIHKLNILTSRSQVRNPAGLRRFPSPHPSLFFLDFWRNFWAQMRRECGWVAYIEGGPCRPRGGDRPPLSPIGGRPPPPPSAAEPPRGPCRPRGGRQAPAPR